MASRAILDYSRDREFQKVQISGVVSRKAQKHKVCTMNMYTE